MEFTAANLNKYLFFKLPSAYWAGVRVKEIVHNQCRVQVRHKWFNQNPFKSMYFAVQAMAAELSTGALVMKYIKESNKKVSMLVAHTNGTYTKKATGVITFTCNDGEKVKDALAKAIATGEGQRFWMTSVGVDKSGDQVSEMNFEWTIKVKIE